MTQPDPQPDSIIIFKDQNNEWRWRRTAANRQVIAVSGEGYENESDCVDMATQLACPRHGVPPQMTVVK